LFRGLTYIPFSLSRCAINSEGERGTSAKHEPLHYFCMREEIENYNIWSTFIIKSASYCCLSLSRGGKNNASTLIFKRNTRTQHITCGRTPPCSEKHKRKRTHTTREQLVCAKTGPPGMWGVMSCFCCIIMMHGQKNELIAKHAADHGARSSDSLSLRCEK
jgi:hypothetical protein